MTKNEALKKVNTVINNNKRSIILEKRLARLENLIKNEDAYDDVDYEDMADEDSEDYNSYDICREILDHYDASDWIGVRDIDEYLDNYYSDMSDEDRWFVHDRMEKFVDVDNYRSVQDDEDWDEDEEDFESCRRRSRKQVKHESANNSAKRSFISRFRK